MWLSPASSKDWGTSVWLLGSSEVGVLLSKYNYGKRKRKVFTRQASSFSTAKYELIRHKLTTFHDIFMPIHTSPSVCEIEGTPGCWDFSAKTRAMLASNFTHLTALPTSWGGKKQKQKANNKQKSSQFQWKQQESSVFILSYHDLERPESQVTLMLYVNNYIFTGIKCSRSLAYIQQIFACPWCDTLKEPPRKCLVLVMLPRV